MTEQEMTEQWLEGCAVQRIMFRDGLVLNFDDYNELVIDPNDPADHERPLFDFAGATCTAFVWYDTGDLHLEFSDGHQIDVHPDDRVTAWELYGKYHGYAACLAPGKLRVVRHDVADANGDQ